MRIAGLAWLMVCALAAPALALGADDGRGRALYETACDRCHDTSVHQREVRKAKSISAIRAEVERWSKDLGVGWSGEEIDDVTVYLNKRYYFFDCPKRLCRVGPTARNIRRRSLDISVFSESNRRSGVALPGGVFPVGRGYLNVLQRIP